MEETDSLKRDVRRASRNQIGRAADIREVMTPLHPVLVDRAPPASDEARAKVCDQAFKFLIAVASHPPIATALAAYGYGSAQQREGSLLLRDAHPYGERASDAILHALHTWVWSQHVRALEAGLKRSHLITLGVVKRRVRAVPEESGIVLKGVPR